MNNLAGRGRLVVLCVLLIASLTGEVRGQNATPTAPAASPVIETVPAAISPALQAALEEFRSQAGRLGIARGSDVTEAGTTARSNTATAQRAAPIAFHGRLYENLRNDFLDAIPHQIVQRGGEQRKLRRNQYGFSVSGPVVIPKVYSGAGKTFFTVSYEGVRQSIGQSRLNTIPTTRERTGDWSQVVDFAGNPLRIYDPDTTAANPQYDPSRPVSVSNLQYNRQQFAGNIIPMTRMDPVALAALQYYPQPNANAGPFFRNNYFVVAPEISRADGFIINVDHSFLQKHRINVKANRSNGVNGYAAIFPTIADPQDPSQDNNTRGLSVEHIFTASPTNINSLRLSANSERYANRVDAASDAKPFSRYEISGYQSMGRWFPTSRSNGNYYQLTDTFSSRWKAHRLSFGVELTQNQVNTYQARFPEGQLQFSAGLTSLPGIINTGHGFASFLLGQANYGERSVTTSPSYFRWGRYRYIFSDQWQISPSLSLNFGLNLETYTPRVEKYNRQSNISFSETNPENGRPGALVAANQGGYGRSFAPTYNKLEPSLGIAWSVLGHNSTVVRADYQRRYDPYYFNFNQFATQAFNGTLTWLSPNQNLNPAVLLRQGLVTNRLFPDLRPEAANGTFPDYVDTSRRQPTYQNIGASIQQQITPTLIVNVRYDNEYGRNQFTGNNAFQPNAIPVSALSYRDQLNDLTFNRSLRPYPQYQNFNINNAPAGRYKSHALAINVEKRSSGGLALSFNYNYRNRWDDYSTGAQNYYDLKHEWARAPYWNPHNAGITFLYELPFGPGKAFLNASGWRQHLVGGWAISGVSNFYASGYLVLRPQFNNTGGVIQNLRVDVVPGVDPKVANQSPDLWFNPAAFAQPANFALGNAPRVLPNIRNPGGYNHDLTVNKRFAVDSGRTLELVASLFNVTNHANWNQPDTTIGPASAPNVNAGKIIGSSGGRIMQLGLRLNF